MNKMTLSFEIVATITAVAILQACAGMTTTATSTRTTQCECATPTLTPPTASGPPGTTITVTITTTTTGAYLRYTLDGSTPTGGPAGHGTLIKAQSGHVPLVFGRTLKMLKAIAYKVGCTDSSVTGGQYGL